MTSRYGGADRISTKAKLAGEPLVREIGVSAEGSGRLRASDYHGQVFTDDLAPVERLIDQIILGYISNSGRN